MGPRRPVRSAFWLPILSVAPLLGGVSGCTAKACAGQCGPPYGLAVTFRPNTTVAEATSALTACADNPEVVYVDPPRVTSGVLGAGIATHDLGTSPKTHALVACLQRSSVVASVGWPD